MEALPLILVLNMRRDVARWDHISSALRQLECPFTRIRAIDGRRHFGLVRARIPRPYYSEVQGRALGPGECCTVLSHIAALKRVIRSQARSAIILEDDAEIDHRFKEFVTGTLQEFLWYCDIVKFAGIEYDYTSKTGPIIAHGPVADLIIPMHPTLGTAAYAVTQVGARRLLPALASVSDPIDHLINYYERHRIPYAETRPLLVGQGRFASNVAAELRALPVERAALATVALRLRHYRVMRGMVRVALASRLIARARLRTIFRFTTGHFLTSK
jgi:GR25 family glycosyltransferase involved in LPS biosynthesis